MLGLAGVQKVFFALMKLEADSLFCLRGEREILHLLRQHSTLEQKATRASTSSASEHSLHHESGIGAEVGRSFWSLPLALQMLRP